MAFALALGLVGCASPAISPSPRSLEESIGRARAQLRLDSPVEILRRRDGRNVLVLYAADAVVDGVGLVVVRADPPWDMQLAGTGEVSNADIGGVSMSQGTDADGTSELTVFGVVMDPRVSELELDLGPDGILAVPASVPGFAVILPFQHEVIFPKWRFLGRDGTTIYDPYR